MNIVRNPAVISDLPCNISGCPMPNTFSWTSDGTDLSWSDEALVLKANSRDHGDNETIICTAKVDGTGETWSYTLYFYLLQ